MMEKKQERSASSYPLRLPGHLLEQAREVAAASGSSLNQFFLAAIAEKVGELKGSLAVRSARADLARARAVLDRVPDAPPEPGDERAVREEEMMTGQL